MVQYKPIINYWGLPAETLDQSWVILGLTIHAQP